MNKYIIFSVVAAAVLLLSCQGSTEQKVRPINPNGDSELALLMRNMEVEGKRMKSEIMQGRKPEVKNYFREMHEAEATEPEKVASETFNMYARAYHNALEMIDESEEDDVPIAYTAMVESCMNCHREMCPGPMVRIKKLYLPDFM